MYFIVMVDENGLCMLHTMKQNCNFVDFSDDNFCMFKNKNYKEDTETTLFMVPYSKIIYIERIGDLNENCIF